MIMLSRDVIIVGAGPAGLAAAIACSRRSLTCEVLEKGVLVNSIYNFPAQMVFFTTPELLEIGGLPLVSPFEKPTRLEALRYYRRVADTFRLPVTLGETVQAVGPAPGGGVSAWSTREDGSRREWRARAAVIAIGYYDHPNLLGVPGEDLPHVSHYYSDPHPFYRKRVVVVGGANSAAETALELYRAGAKVTLVHRHAALSDSIKYWVLPDIQNRIKEGSIGARFNARVVEITREGVEVEASAPSGPRADEPRFLPEDSAQHASIVPMEFAPAEARRETMPADAVFLLTGYHPDREFMERCGISFDARTCLPIHDPITLETNVPNVFLAGGVISDQERHPIFIENGRMHGEKVVEVIAARIALDRGTTQGDPDSWPLTPDS
jgi:thioredoxin reductase (NADPH)